MPIGRALKEADQAPVASGMRLWTEPAPSLTVTCLTPGSAVPLIAIACASVTWSPGVPVSGENPVMTGGGGGATVTRNAAEAALTSPNVSVAVAVKL